MAALASDWPRHFRFLLWNRRTEFDETWQEARSQRPLPRLCFSSRSEKQDGHPGLWLAETFSTSALKLLNKIQRNLTGRRISTSSTKFVFFRPIGKTKWPSWPIHKKRWHIVLRCTICGPLGLLFEKGVSQATSSAVSAWMGDPPTRYSNINNLGWTWL